MPVLVGNQFFKSCDELFSGRRGVPWQHGNRRDYTRRFRVVVRRKDMSVISIALAPGLPQPYTIYVSGKGVEYDVLALLIKYQVDQEYQDDWQNWVVTCEYSTELPKGGQTVSVNGTPVHPGTGSGSQPGAANDPKLEPPEIEWDFEVVQEARRKDLNGKAFTNSAQMPFSPPPTFEVAYPVLMMSRNEQTYSKDTAAYYAFAVNTDTFLGHNPGAVLCLPPKAKRMSRGPMYYWRVSYRIRFQVWQDAESGDYISFQPQLLDQGTYKWQGNPALPNWKKQVPIRRNGKEITHPVLLDGVGGEAVADVNGIIQPHYRNFTVYKQASFADLLVYGMS